MLIEAPFIAPSGSESDYPAVKLRASTSPTKRIALLLASALFGAGVASAQSNPTDGSKIYRLTPEQKAELLAADGKSDGDAATVEGNSCSQNRQVHGEVGAVIGTGGTRGAFGTTAIPLGCEGGVVISFESQQSGYQRFR